MYVMARSGFSNDQTAMRRVIWGYIYILKIKTHIENNAIDNTTIQETFAKFQKQPSEVFYKERCSYKFRKIQRKTPVPRLFFNKVAGLRPVTLLKKRPWHRCFPVNFTKFPRIPFLQNTPGRLVLKFGG